MLTSSALVVVALLAALYALRARRLAADALELKALLEVRAAGLVELTEQLEVANAAVADMASADSITGLANRRRFDVFIHREWQRSSRNGRPLSLMLVDNRLCHGQHWRRDPNGQELSDRERADLSL